MAISFIDSEACRCQTMLVARFLSHSLSLSLEWSLWQLHCSSVTAVSERVGSKSERENIEKVFTLMIFFLFFSTVKEKNFLIRQFWILNCQKISDLSDEN